MTIYVAGRYTHTTAEERTAYVALGRKASVALIRDGYNPICTFIQWESFEHESVLANMTHVDWLDLCVEHLSFCDAICLLPGWRESKGASQEYLEALAHGLRVLSYDADNDKIVEGLLE